MKIEINIEIKMGRAKKVKFSYYTHDPNILLGNVFINLNKQGMYSTDGKTFTLGTTFINGYSVDYSPTLDRWVAGDINGGRYSDDGGITWTGFSYKPTSSDFTSSDVIWVSSKSKFFLVGYDSIIPQSAESTDGINWITKAQPLLTDPGNLTYSPTLDMFITSGEGGSNLINISTDNLTSWTPINVGLNTGNKRVYWVDYLGLFMIFAYENSNRGLYRTSTDGINWTPRNMGYNGEFFRNLAVGLDSLLYRTASTCWRSTDGLSWTQVYPPNLTNNGIEDPVFDNANNIYYNFGSPTYTSTDGLSWTSTGRNDVGPRLFASSVSFKKRY
jgi:hypothetical protein